MVLDQIRACNGPLGSIPGIANIGSLRAGSVSDGPAEPSLTHPARNKRPPAHRNGNAPGWHPSSLRTMTTHRLPRRARPSPPSLAMCPSARSAFDWVKIAWKAPRSQTSSRVSKAGPCQTKRSAIRGARSSPHLRPYSGCVASAVTEKFTDNVASGTLI